MLNLIEKRHRFHFFLNFRVWIQNQNSRSNFDEALNKKQAKDSSRIEINNRNTCWKNPSRDWRNLNFISLTSFKLQQSRDGFFQQMFGIVTNFYQIFIDVPSKLIQHFWFVFASSFEIEKEEEEYGLKCQIQMIVLKCFYQLYKFASHFSWHFLLSKSNESDYLSDPSTSLKNMN